MSDHSITVVGGGRSSAETALIQSIRERTTARIALGVVAAAPRVDWAEFIRSAGEITPAVDWSEFIRSAKEIN
jgi:hypothetical protein